MDSGTGSSAKATATFVLAVEGQATQLQVLTIKSQVWKTIVSGKQDSTGKMVFSISDPLEVLHEYRAMSGTPPTISNTVKYQAGSNTKNTGLSTSTSTAPTGVRTTWWSESRRQWPHQRQGAPQRRSGGEALLVI